MSLCRKDAVRQHGVMALNVTERTHGYVAAVPAAGCILHRPAMDALWRLLIRRARYHVGVSSRRGRAAIAPEDLARAWSMAMRIAA